MDQEKYPKKSEFNKVGKRVLTKIASFIQKAK